MNPTVTPPRRGITISMLLEFVLAVAIGLALQRFVARSILTARGPVLHLPLMSSRIFLVGFASGFCLGLSAETSLRRHEPIPWGIGRWTLAIVAASSLFVGAQVVVAQTISCFQGMQVPVIEEMVSRVFTILSVGFIWIPHFLAGLWLVAWLSGRRMRGTVDAREWAGRLVAAGLGGLSAAGILLHEYAFR